MSEPSSDALIPEWIPDQERGALDLCELAPAQPGLAEACKTLGERLQAHVAAYRAGAVARPAGLCSVFKHAELGADGCALLRERERSMDGVILVAYARPLQRWQHRTGA